MRVRTRNSEQSPEQSQGRSQSFTRIAKEQSFKKLYGKKLRELTRAEERHFKIVSEIELDYAQKV